MSLGTAERSVLSQPRVASVARLVAMLAVAVVMLTAATDFFPDSTLVGVVTPLRLVIACGLIALPFTGARWTTLRTRIDIPIGILVVVAAAGTLLGGRPGAPLRELLVEVAVFYLVVGLRRTRPESRAAVSILALVSVAIAATVAFSQVNNQTPTGFCGGGFLGDVTCGNGAMIRAEGTFSNPNELAAFLLLLAPTAILARNMVRDRLAQTVLVGLAICGGAAVLVTFSRGAYAGIVAGVAAAMAARTLFRKLGRVQLTLIVTAATLATAGSAMVVAVLSRHDQSLGLRGTAWTAALRIAAAHPLLGVGLGRAGSVITALTGVDFAHAHNMWLNWLVETGVPGLVAITAITVIAVVSAARLASQGSAAGACELAGLTGFLLMSLLDDPANSSRIAVAMWLLIGLVMAETPARWRVRAEEEPSLDPGPDFMAESMRVERDDRPKPDGVTEPLPAVAVPSPRRSRRPAQPASPGTPAPGTPPAPATLPPPAAAPLPVAPLRSPAPRPPVVPGRPTPGRPRVPPRRNDSANRYPPQR